MFKKIVVIIFFALSIRTSAYADTHQHWDAGTLILNGYEVLHTDRDENNLLTLILMKPQLKLAYLCKINDFKYSTPVNVGCWAMMDLPNKK